jgi:hypothetical protein
MNKTYIKDSNTRQPSLTCAVIRQLGGRDSLEDICTHGVSGGFTGFIYYTDTVAFSKRNKAQILARLRDDAGDMGAANVWELLAGFGCFKGMTQDKIVEGFYEASSDHRQAVYNGLAWYAAEEIARELNPEL